MAYPIHRYACIQSKRLARVHTHTHKLAATQHTAASVHRHVQTTRENEGRNSHQIVSAGRSTEVALHTILPTKQMNEIKFIAHASAHSHTVQTGHPGACSPVARPPSTRKHFPSEWYASILNHFLNTSNRAWSTLQRLSRLLFQHLCISI